MMMMGHSSDTPLFERLLQEARTHRVDYLAYLFVPRQGEGMLIEVGEPPEGPQARQVQSAAGPRGRCELHWSGQGSYSAGQAAAMLDELEANRRSQPPPLSNRLHSGICQSLTAAHMQLELGLMSQADPVEEFELARELVQQANASVRELLCELAGDPT
jgi:hypothetical protein